MPFSVKGIFYGDLEKIMMGIVTVVLKETGLDHWQPMVRDKFFWLAAVAGVLVWIVVWLTIVPTFSIQDKSVTILLFTGIIYYPVLEEILFRGIIQGWFSKQSWGKRIFLNLTIANWLTSLLFVVAHFWYQPVLWAFLVIAPSLVYGFFKDRYSNIYPSIILHALYNGGFLLVNLMAQ